MKKINLSSMEAVKGGLSAECKMSMGLSMMAGGMLLGVVGAVAGIASAYLYNPACH